MKQVLPFNNRWRHTHITLPAMISGIYVFTVLILKFLQKQINITSDGAVYLFSGVGYVTGRPPYLFLWDIKPPGIGFTTGAIALLTGDNRLMTIVFSLILTGTVCILISICISKIIYDYTDDTSAAVLGGISMYALPWYGIGYAWGPYVKYYAAAALVATLYFAQRERPILTGITAAVAPLYWQFAIISVFAGFVLTKPNDRRYFILGGMSIFAGTVVLLLLAGNLSAAVLQTIIAPLIIGGSSTAPLLDIWRFFGYPGGIAGAAAQAILLLSSILTVILIFISWRDRDRLRIVSTGLVIWFAVLGTALGQTGRPDLILLACCLALIIGISYPEIKNLLQQTRIRQQMGISNLYWLILFSLILTILALNIVQNRWSIGGNELAVTFIKNGEITQCHIRMSWMEEHWLERIGGSRNAVKCIDDLGLIRELLF